MNNTEFKVEYLFDDIRNGNTIIQDQIIKLNNFF